MSSLDLGEADEIMMRRNSAHGTLDLIARGGDPLHQTPRFGGPITPQMEMERRFIFERKRNFQIDTVLNDPANRFSEFTKFMDDTLQQYKTLNQTEKIKAPKNEQEAISQIEQMRPITVDPNVMADMRQIAAKIDQQLKAIDPTDSFFTNPKTKKHGDWLNREAGGGGLGYIESGEQPIRTPGWESPLVNPITSTISGPAADIMNIGTQLSAHAAYGIWHLANMGIQSLGGPDIGPQMPFNYIEGPDGKLYTNGGKVPDYIDGLSMMWAAATSRNIEQEVASMRRTREMEDQSMNGLETLVRGASRVAGMGIGFAPGGLAMSVGTKLFGNGIHKGLVALAASNTPRAQAIVRISSRAISAGLGNGMLEAVAFGNAEGYGKAFAHGMMMTPVLMAMGVLGRRAEWFAKNRVNMPGFAAQQVGAAMEGVGFGALEAHAPDLLPSAWGFIRDPSDSTWDIYARNMAGFMLMKAAMRGHQEAVTPGQMAMEAARFHVERAGARAQFAERMVRGEVAAEQAPAGSEAGLRALGEASEKLRQAASPEEQGRLREQIRDIETGLDVEEFGIRGKAQREFEKVTAEEAVEEPSELLMAARKRAQTAATPELRREAIADVRRLEAVSAGKQAVEIVPGYKAETRRSPRTAGATEVLVRDSEGNVAGSVEFFSEGKTARLLNAEVSEGHRGKGITSETLKEILRTHPEGFTTASPLTEAMQKAFKRAGIKAPEFELAEAAVKLGQHGTTKSGRRFGPQSLQQPPTTKTAAEPGVAQVRASDIMLEMEGRPGRKGFRIPFTSVRVGGTKGDPVRVPFRSGKLAGEELGVFKFFENLVRTEEGRDLVVASHEWSHAMQRHALGRGGKSFQRDAKLQLQEALQFDPAIQTEMATMLKDYAGASKLPQATRWMETWAEWHARNLLGEVGLDVKFPALGKFMRGWLAQPAQAALRGQYQRIQDMLYRYNAQGSVARVRQSIVLGSDPLSEAQKAQKPSALQRASDVVTKHMFDDMVELKRSQEKWLEAVGRKPEDVSILDDPARLFDALRMTATKTAEHYIMRGFDRPDGHVKGMREVLETVKGREEQFVTYLASLRNLQILKSGREAQLPAQDYIEAIKKLQTENPDFRKAAREFKQWTDQLVDYVARSGNLDADQADRIKDAYVVYVPFFRAIEGPAQRSAGRGVAERGTGLARLKGSTFEIRDPLVAMQEVATSLIAKAHQNMVMKALYKLAHGQEAGGLATVVPKTNVPHDHPVAQVLRALSETAKAVDPAFGGVIEALRASDTLNEQTLTLFTQKTIPTGERNIIAFTPRLTTAEIDALVADGANRPRLLQQNNKLQWLELDTKVYEALMGIDKNPLSDSPIMKMLQVPRDVVRFFATGVSPGFVAANLIRDAMSEPIFSRSGAFRPFGGFVKLVRGAIEYHRNGETRRLYEELGVKTSSFLSEGRKRDLAGQHKRWRDRFSDWADSAQQFFSHPENYLRIAEFKDTLERARAEGASPEEARMLALEAGREITVNFARAGLTARMLNQMIPYFNAGLQGKRKLYGQLLWGGDVKGDANKARVQRAAILNGLANITAPAVALWLINKDEEWYQDLPEWRKINYFNFQVGDEIVSIPKPFEAGVIFGALPEILLDQQVEHANPASMKRAAIDALGGYMEGIGALIPAALRPLVEIGTNYNFFTGRQITPEWISRSAVPSEQASFYTAETARVLSRAVNGILTPTEIEHVLGGYTAGATTSAMRALDEILGLKDHPVAGVPWARFTKQQAHGQSAFVDDLYAKSVELDQLEGSGQITTQQRSLKRRIDNAKREISELRKQSRAGTLKREEAEERSYRIARPLVEESKR